MAPVSVTILTGDARQVLATLADKSVQCCVTSPPYYGLRDYGAAGQIGLEPTPEEYVAELVDVFRQVRRVLRDDGTLWLNLGDSYCRAPAKGGSGPGGKNGAAYGDAYGSAQSVKGSSDGCVRRGDRPGTRAAGDAKEKDLLGIPWLVAFALRADGWYLRSDVIWHKPNPMPESVVDRPTSAHEHVFLLTKSASYFYDAEAIAEGATNETPSGNGFKRPERQSYKNDNGVRGSDARWTEVGSTRNARNVWTIATQPFSGAHFATMPPELVDRCIRAGTSDAGACAACGAPHERVVELGERDAERQSACGGDRNGEYHGSSRKNHEAAGVQDASAVKARILAGMRKKLSTSWRPTCECGAGLVPCMVLDPFGGAGTTAVVADRRGRDATTIEINPEYVAIQRARLLQDGGLFASIAEAAPERPGAPRQEPLL